MSGFGPSDNEELFLMAQEDDPTMLADELGGLPPLDQNPDQLHQYVSSLPPELQDLMLLEEENCRRIEVVSEVGLRLYIEDMWPVVEPSRPFVNGWYIGYICEHLAAVTMGQIRELLINIPPRHGKSTVVSIMWPTWEWGPAALAHLRWLFSSYAQSL